MRKFILAAFSIIAIVACGGGGGGYGGGGGGGGEPDPAFEEIRPWVAEACGRCHNGTKHPLNFGDAAIFKNSKAKNRINNGTMPPDRALPEEYKQAFLEYLGS